MPVDLLSHSCSDEILIRQLIFRSQRTLIKYIYLDTIKSSSMYFFSNVMRYNRDHKQYKQAWHLISEYIAQSIQVFDPNNPYFLNSDAIDGPESHCVTILKETFLCTGMGVRSDDCNSWALYSTFNSTINLTYDCVLAQIPQQHQWSWRSSL